MLNGSPYNVMIGCESWQVSVRDGCLRPFLNKLNH